MSYDTNQKGYFDWLCECVVDSNKANEYSDLLNALYDKEFTYINPYDRNRLVDGLNLRCRYLKSFNKVAFFDDIVKNSSCSVLEVMVALAIRCEEQIMQDSNYGDRTSIWFWDMVESLGLSDFSNDQFDYIFVNDVLDDFLDRNYAKNGKGGLFTLKRSKLIDMPNVEIWYQMCWYLDEHLEEEENGINTTC